MTTFIIIILAICLTIQYVVALVKEHFWLEELGLLDEDMWWEVCSDNVEGNF